VQAKKINKKGNPIGFPFLFNHPLITIFTGLNRPQPMKKYLYLLIVPIALNACISAQRVDGFVQRYYAEEELVPEISELPWARVSPPMKALETPSLSKRTKAQFIPAILYWQWNTQVETDIDDAMVTRRFEHFLAVDSRSAELRKIVGENSIEFSFQSAPSAFTYSHKGNTLILLFAYSITDKIGIEPSTEGYTLSYKLRSPSGELLKNGEITTGNSEIELSNVWKSNRKFVWLYLDEYHKHQDYAFLTLLNDLNKALSNN